MKTLISLFAVLLFTTGLTVASFGASSGSCSGGTFLGLGGSCTVTCQTGYHPVCSSGFLSSSCSCEPDGAAEGPKERILPSTNPQQQMLAQEFITWAHRSASPVLQQLGTLAENSTTAWLQHNGPAFSMAETQFGQAWQALPFPDQQATANWRAQHGLGN